MTESKEAASQDPGSDLGTGPPDEGKPCGCVADPFADLPPELRPKPGKRLDGLRKVTCPRCGLEYWTNRKTEVCMACEHKGG